ncbi:MAG: SpoIIE family protein phosphatase [Actinomycetes bacterium]
MGQRSPRSSSSTGADAVGPVDYRALFDVAPSPYLVLDPELRIVTANRARLSVTGRRLDDIVGRYVFDVFPGQPDRPEGGSAAPILASFRRVLESGEPDTMAVQRYDIPTAEGEAFVERYWSPVNVPVLDGEGNVQLILHRAEDVTEFILAGRAGTAGGGAGAPEVEGWRQRVEEAQAELYARSQELVRLNQQLTESRDREVRTSTRLAALVQVAQRLADVEQMEDLTSAVIDEGLAALGVDGGAVAVRDDERGVVRLVFASLSERARQKFEQLALEGRLPASWVARTGEPLLLPDLPSGFAWADEMTDVYETTGLEAWASLPLTESGAIIGSLTVGWSEPHEFASSELELLEAFAAQCAQAISRVRRLAAERKESEIARQMAETLQRSLLTAPPEPDHLHVMVYYEAALAQAKVGGDWFDAFLTPDGATSIVIGDVTGHDQNAVAAMGQIRNILRGVAYTLVEPPAAVLSALDRTLRGMSVDALATMVLANIEQTNADEVRGVRRFRWSNAGHLPPLLLRPGGYCELLERHPNLLVGLDPHCRRDDHEVDLHPGDTVLLYTDGLVERRTELLSAALQRLRYEAAELTDLPLEDLLKELLERMAPPRDDDIALVAVRPYPEDEPRPPEAGPTRVPDELPSVDG